VFGKRKRHTISATIIYRWWLIVTNLVLFYFPSRIILRNGHRIFGYHYVKKTSTAPATLAINEEQAAVVRSIFEMFVSGNYGLVTSSRHLEERRVLTCKGRQRWDNDQIKSILKNETYTDEPVREGVIAARPNGFVAPCIPTRRQGAGRARLGLRDQARRTPADRPPRRREGAAVYPAGQ
jgi:Recombinase